MIYLASSSPRRAELLRQIGVEFEILKCDIDETARPGETVIELVQRLSIAKARCARELLDTQQRERLVLAADTLIELDGHIIGKPRDRQECGAILTRLSGREHHVHSAVAVVDQDDRFNIMATVNRIRFRQLTNAEIANYCACGEPLDKAGAYAIQGRAAMFIEHLSGSYSAVMGLPLFETAQLLEQAGYRFFARN